MNITLKDGSAFSVEKGLSAYEVAKSISPGLARAACAAVINGEPVDLRTEVPEGASFSVLNFEDEYGRHAFRHSASHLMAQAVQRLYPGAKFAIGPAIKDGFYYDIEFPEPLVEEDLPKIEAEMKKIVKADDPIERFKMSREEAIAYFEKLEQPYKVELVKDLPEGEVISFYRQDDFTDLCAGPHLMRTGQIKAFKLTSLAGAYWRGDEHNTMLTRIYGTCFPKKALLDEYLERIEEAKRRDHRKLGREMELFTILDEGPGFPVFLPNGMRLKNALMEYWREIHVREGYLEISTPMILSRRLWEESGHWAHYRENMYTTKIDDEDYAIKPMNCPGAMLVYKSKPRSYRDLPLRLAEMGVVHRHEMSGALHGLMRVRCFTQDDAHIFITPEQITDEVRRIAGLIDKLYKKFGFKYHVELSTRPEDSMGTDEEWEQATDGLRTALEAIGLPYVVNEGDGAFYGPKIDYHLEDSIGRTWQCGTIQLDFQLPQRFHAEYVGADGEKHQPIVIHRVAYGSIERFIGILIEHYAGAFPTWLAPTQVALIPVNREAHGAACQALARELEAEGVRVSVDDSEETLGKKIRNAQVAKVTYQLVIGDQEVEQRSVTVRHYGSKDTQTLAWDDFKRTLVDEIHTRR
uniref:threonine--tRNA ligase n=1 Tax=Ndongobacter massiliensis TaxID=1871025 RepID=UPI000930CC5A|nr:threonine--tRNA ligase [Ndongobacter massiliensis]